MSVPTPVKPDAGTEVAEIAGDLQRSLAHYLDWAVREWRTMLAQVEKQQQGYVPAGQRDDLAALRDFTRSAIDTFERIGRDGAGLIDHLEPADLSWRDISAEWTRDEAAGQALWGKVGKAARQELAGGAIASQAIEGYHPRPMDRAQFLAIREALADGLQPRNAMEQLLIDGMAQAWVLHLRWLGKHSKMDSLEAIRSERDMRHREGWEPPRLSEAEAVDRAAQMADRFQRQFLRLMKTYRDGRRLIASMTVRGGQVNVADQQVVVTGSSDPVLP